MDPFLVLGLAVYATMGTILLVGVWLGKKEMRATKVEVQAIKDLAIPLMEKANSLLTPETVQNLTDLRMIPGTITAGMEKLMRDQLETTGSPLRLYTRALIDEGTSALGVVLEDKMSGMKQLIPAAASVLGKAGAEVRVDKKEGREAVAAIMENFGPAAKIIEKFVPASKREDPVEFLSYLGRAKAQISAVAPGVGSMLDGLIEQAIMGGEAGAGIFGGDASGLVKMLPSGTAAKPTDGTPDYMRS